MDTPIEEAEFPTCQRCRKHYTGERLVHIVHTGWMHVECEIERLNAIIRAQSEWRKRAASLMESHYKWLYEQRVVFETPVEGGDEAYWRARLIQLGFDVAEIESQVHIDSSISKEENDE